ncbi:uncharacterized protein EDB93DRAFT_1109752, partial [Suillus bovinus]|uniref:uncharacterized protein n=1 Tax=Suillus bovinus TaxID=48563 RepID=UPI001B88409A
ERWTARPNRANTPGPIETRDHQHDFAHGLDVDFSLINSLEPELVDAAALPTYSCDDIKVEHHPNSGIKMKVHPFDSFHRRPAASSVHTPPDNQPWCPFQSQLEFNIAELALEARLNNEQTDRLIRICLHSSVGKDKFTFRNHKDIHSKWEAASHWITKGSLGATDLLRDPCLFPHFTFDAQRLSKFDGQNFVHFVDEPFTAQDFWDVQSQLPPDAKPLAFIFHMHNWGEILQESLHLFIELYLMTEVEQVHPFFECYTQSYMDASLANAYAQSVHALTDIDAVKVTITTRKERHIFSFISCYTYGDDPDGLNHLAELLLLDSGGRTPRVFRTLHWSACKDICRVVPIKTSGTGSGTTSY